MSEQVVIAVISSLVGLILGGAANNFLVAKPLQEKLNSLDVRLARVEETVKGIAYRDRRNIPTSIGEPTI
jgi:hypothetical protein